MTAIKDKIDAVISERGSDITVRTNTISATRDEWGKPVTDSSADRTIKAVKDNYLKFDFKLNQSGRMDAGSVLLIVQGDETFDSRTDKFVFDGKTYNLLQEQPLELSGEVLAKLIEIGED